MRAKQTENARALFERYGFMPTRTFRFQGIHKNYRVFDEVNNRFINYKYQNFLNDVQTGKIKEVDPFLHTLSVANAPSAKYPRQSTADRLTRYTNYFPIETFKKEPANIRADTMKKATELKAQCNPKKHPESILINRTGDNDKDKASIYAIIDTLYVISSFNWKNVKISLQVYFRVDNAIADYHFPQIYYINEDTIALFI